MHQYRSCCNHISLCLYNLMQMDREDQDSKSEFSLEQWASGMKQSWNSSAAFPGVRTCKSLVVPGTSMHAALNATDERSSDKYSEDLWAAANLQVVLEDLQPTPYIWQRHCNMAVKAAWPGESCIKILLHVGGRHDNDALIRLKAVHLQEHEVSGGLCSRVQRQEKRGTPGCFV